MPNHKIPITTHKIHIIGAGLAGLAAAVKLTAAGRQVAVYEAAPQAGGRCRSYLDATLGKTVDNGNHLVVGANRDALAYICAIGSKKSFVTGNDYAFIDLSSGEHFAFRRTYALAALAKLAFARCTMTVNDCISSESALYRNFVDPFCTSALNTNPPQASAALLRSTLWKLVKAGSKGLRYYLPRENLAQSFIHPALALLAEVHFSRAVKSLVWENGEVTALQFADSQISTKGHSIILATSCYAAARLLPDAKMTDEPSAILNGHFLCPALDWPAGRHFLGLTGGLAHWLFYRDGVLSTTTSAANAFVNADHAAIAQSLWNDICKALTLARALPPHRIVVEKRATRLATPDSLAAMHTGYGNLRLAGDYTQPHLPATIDSAVKSGFEAAEKILRL